jgi:hypothetical protein
MIAAMLLQIDDIFWSKFCYKIVKLILRKKIGKACFSTVNKKVITFMRPNKWKN